MKPRRDGKMVGARLTGPEAAKVARDAERLGYGTLTAYFRVLLGLDRPDPTTRRLRRRRLILDMVRAGKGNAEIAKALRVAPRTVSNEIGHLRREGVL